MSLHHELGPSKGGTVELTAIAVGQGGTGSMVQQESSMVRECVNRRANSDNPTTASSLAWFTIYDAMHGYS